MPNNTRTQADGTWVDGYQPPKTDWEDLERKIFGSWNGDRGGAYCAPGGLVGSAYTFGGSGLQVTGPTRLTYGGAIYGRASCFKIRNTAWPLLGAGHGSRSRSIVQPIREFVTNKRYLWSRNHPYGGIGSVALACRTTYGRKIETADVYIPLRVVDGSTLTKVDLHFRVSQRRLFAPIAMPQLRILRVPKDSVANAPAPLKATADGTGFDFSPLVTTPSDWYLDGNAQTFSYVCDQNNVIDVSAYSYMAHLVEEVGALSPEDSFDGVRFVERKADVLATTRNIDSSSVLLTLNGNLTVDGVATGTDGARILVVDSDTVLSTGDTDSNSAINGIWNTAAGAWLRSADADEQLDFTPNWITKATNGSVNSAACWQCQHPSKASKVDLITTAAASTTKTQPRFVPAEPKGNIYHSLVPFFELTDLRFQ